MKNAHTYKIRITLIFLLFCGLCSITNALEWSNSDIQYLHGSGYLFGAQNRNIVTLEHSSGWQYGQNYLFVDTINRQGNSDPLSWEAYGEFYTFLSAKKIGGIVLSERLIKDFGITLGFNAGSQPDGAPFRAYLAGGSIQFNLPQFQFFQLDFLAYRNEHLHKTAVQITPSWELPFKVFGFSFCFRGFLDYVTAGGSGPNSTLLFQPQFILDVGNFIGYSNHFFIGTEYQYWHNKFGLNGFEERLPQALAMYRF